MSTSPTPAGATATAQTAPARDASLGELATQLSEQVSRLVRDELALAKVETTERAKQVGVGAGLFGVTAVLAWFGVGTLVAAAVLGLANAVSAWLAAVIVGIALFVVAGVSALLGKGRVQKGTPPVPTATVASVQEDVRTVKGAVSR